MPDAFLSTPAPTTGNSPGPIRVVVLISGTGSLLQALLDAGDRSGYGATVVAVGADRDGIAGLERARAAGVPTFVLPVDSLADRSTWDQQLAAAVAEHRPELVICAGFMRLLGPAFLDRFGGRTLNTHPALLPSFPGMHGPRDALAYGVKITGASVILVDAGVDTGVIIDQAAVPVADTDTVESLHERIKIAERKLLVDVVHRLATQSWRVTDRRVRWES